MSKNGKQKQSNQRRESTNFRWFFGHIFSLLRRHGSSLMMWTVIGWGIWVAGRVLEAYAGQQTFADVSVKILASVNLVFTLSIALSGISVSLYLRERRLHRKTRKRLTERITALELIVDPTRTSSKLTPEGLTRREDEL